ncbi:helix-turn-helix domain-containing protein [Rhodoferax antarcticus]|uniref:helix-turn-helix domain-containing protein n=1 Tax=Rhodoferax antarcticus TaxID=81479 RepID=UPI0009581972|nr:helix-turn-helix transcriptional regulator [Rhodoferax antarcticus]APW48670.1 hypothetical protein RA876_19640 [Rhodoferax antarcticus]
MLNNKWVSIDPLADDPAIKNGGAEASEFFARRIRNPARAQRLAAARSKLGQALEATYGKRTGLVALRLKLGLSQTELAKRMDTQQPSIARWERAPSTMSHQNMTAMAQALGVDAVQVFLAIQEQREIELKVEEHEAA